MGFGHRVYKNYDPRAAVLRESAHEVLAELGKADDPLLPIARSSRRSRSRTTTSSSASCSRTSTSIPASSCRRWASRPRCSPRSSRWRARSAGRAVERDDRGPGAEDRPAPPALHRPDPAHLRAARAARLSEARTAPRPEGCSAMRRLLLVIVALAGLLAAGPALAQSAPPPSPAPPSCAALAELLRDPAIQSWLQAQAEARAGRRPQAAAASEPPRRPSGDGRPAGCHARVPARARGGGPDAARRARPGLDDSYRRDPGARRAQRGRAAGRLRGARLRPRVAVLVGDDRVPRSA